MAFIRINSCRINITTVCCKVYFMTGALFLIFTVVPSNLRITSLVREAHFYYSFIRQIRDESLWVSYSYHKIVSFCKRYFPLHFLKWVSISASFPAWFVLQLKNRQIGWDSELQRPGCSRPGDRTMTAWPGHTVTRLRPGMHRPALHSAIDSCGHRAVSECIGLQMFDYILEHIVNF